MPDDQQLLDQARRVREAAHAPYSKFRVGAAVLDEQGRVHLGCNVENAAYPLGSCAEPNAIAAMVAAGGKRIARIAIVGGAGEPVACLPCGGCRQRISEFADDRTRIIVLDDDGNPVEHTVAAVLPGAFRLDP